jgi:hypothetical protein
MEHVYDLPSPAFAAVLAAEQAGAIRTRKAFYETVAGWAPVSVQLPRRSRLVLATDMRESTFTAHFKRGNYPRLAAAIGSDMDGVHRCVVETKEMTLTPWLVGWRRMGRHLKLGPDQMGDALLRTVASWAVRHRGLALMADAEMPPCLDFATQGLFGAAQGAERVAFARIVDRCVRDVCGDPFMTPLMALNRVRGELRRMEFGVTDTRRRSLELVAAIGRFMELASDLQEADPQLERILAIALRELRESPSREDA